MSDYRRGLAFTAGVRAFNAGKPTEKCDRQPGTIFYDDWHDGWREAQSKAPATPTDQVKDAKGGGE